jgi:hypothetical protein
MRPQRKRSGAARIASAAIGPVGNMGLGNVSGNIGLGNASGNNASCRAQAEAMWLPT